MDMNRMEDKKQSRMTCKWNISHITAGIKVTKKQKPSPRRLVAGMYSGILSTIVSIEFIISVEDIKKNSVVGFEKGLLVLWRP